VVVFRGMELMYCVNKLDDGLEGGPGGPGGPERPKALPSSIGAAIRLPPAERAGGGPLAIVFVLLLVMGLGGGALYEYAKIGAPPLRKE